MTPLVSVAMISYNHRQFIAAALDSVIAQVRDFPIEIVINDDASPDGTGDVVAEYARRHPELVRNLSSRTNVGMFENLARVWQSCRGTWIAILEGDDYWHAPDKLARQLAWMAQHPECVLSGHRVRVVSEAGTEDFPAADMMPPAVSTIDRLLRYNYLQTCSVLLRRGVVPQLPQWLRPMKLIDWPLFILQARAGSVGFLDESLATYRKHAGGVWSPLQAAQQNEHLYAMFAALRHEVPREHRAVVDGRLLDLAHDAYVRHASAGESRAARRHLGRYIRTRHRLGWLSTPAALRLLRRWFAPCRTLAQSEAP